VTERFPSGQREQTVNLPADAFGGSNPPLSTIKAATGRAGIAQLVEHEPSKLGVAGSNPVSRSIVLSVFIKRHEAMDDVKMCLRPDAHVAQSVEHFLGKEEVTGSIPVVGFARINTGGYGAARVEMIRCGI
jgi:hypothetical protein